MSDRTDAGLVKQVAESQSEIAFLKGVVSCQQDTLNDFKQQIAALKSVSLEPKFVWHKVENEDECDVFSFSDVGHTNCEHCINLYTAEQINKMKESCRKCGGDMKPSKAIEQTYTGSPDFAGGEIVTMSPGGSGTLVDCLKCGSCGWSVTKEKRNDPQH